MSRFQDTQKGKEALCRLERRHKWSPYGSLADRCSRCGVVRDLPYIGYISEHVDTTATNIPTHTVEIDLNE